MGGSPNWVITERSSKLITLLITPACNRHVKVVVKSSLADLKILISASHWFALVWTRDTASTCKLLSSELSSLCSFNCCFLTLTAHFLEPRYLCSSLMKLFTTAVLVQ